MSIKLWKYILQAKYLCERLYPIKNAIHGNFLVVQWLRFHTFTTKGPGLISGLGAEILQTTWPHQKKKKSAIHISNSVWKEIWSIKNLEPY